MKPTIVCDGFRKEESKKLENMVKLVHANPLMAYEKRKVKTCKATKPARKKPALKTGIDSTSK